LQKLADLVGKEDESDAQKFDRAFAKGGRSRIPRSAEIMRALSELSALEKVSKAGPVGARSVLTESPPRSASATPPASRGFRFTADTLAGAPAVPRPDDTPRVPRAFRLLTDTVEKVTALEMWN